jgi:replicative DNA helicase
MWKIRNGQMRDPEWTDYVLTGQRLEELPLHIDDTGGLSLPQLASRARRAKREHKIEGIVVDYLQLMDGTRAGSYQQNRVQELTHITKGLKALAKELDVPILALSQLSRGVDSRDDKRPVLSDLRESGSIEQDADAVLFVYRQEYYVKSREPDVSDPRYCKWQESMEKFHGRADVIVEKHRHGATGTVRLGFDGRFSKFSNLEP